jgi:oligopeptide transport system substrate-binding protein
MLPGAPAAMLPGAPAAMLAVALVVGAGGLVACDNHSRGSSATGSTAVVTVNIGEPLSIVPPNLSETEGGQVIYATFAGLRDYDANARPYNVIADTITTTDSVVWTIRLKDGFTFHNGEKVTSQSFIDAWNWAAYGPNASNANSYFQEIDGYAAMNPSASRVAPTAKTLSGLKRIDDLTFTVTLSGPFVDFDTELSSASLYPVPRAAFNPDGSITKAYQEAPIGDGPFKIKGRWNHDKNIEVERFAGWKGARPKVAGINFKIYQDQKAQYADALAGTLDVDRRVDPSNLPNAKRDFGTRYGISPLSAIQYLAFPTYDQTFANPDVRKAISMAIDRDTIANTIFSGTVRPARSFVSPVLPGYRPDVCGDACVFNPGAARSLYRTAGGPSTIRISYNVDGGHQAWIEAVCNQLQTNLDVTCQPRGEPKFADLLQKLKGKDQTVGMFRVGWVMPYPSMYAYLFQLFDTASIPTPNFSGYSNPRFDDLLRRGTAAPTHAEAISLWRQAEDLLAKDLPAAPMRYDQNVYVVSRTIKHVDVNLLGWVNPYTVEVG